MLRATRPSSRGAALRRPLDLVLLYNATREIRRGNESDELPDFEDGLEHITRALESLGHTVRSLGVTYDNLDVLDTLQADFVLNLCDGTGFDGHPGLEVTAALEARGIPFSGAGSWCYFQTNEKWRTKLVLSAARVPVPRGVVAPSAEVPIPAVMKYPLFVKPRDAYGSLGVDEGSVVHGPEEAAARVAHVVDEYGCHALVEEYVEGREITVGVLGAGEEVEVLPPLEVCFGHAYDGKPHIRMFATKHEADSELYTDFQTVCPAPLEPWLEAKVKAVALQAYRAVGGDGYCRVDMRLAPSGTPYVLEVNANPSLEDGEKAEDCGMFTLIGRALGWSYPELLARIIEVGLRRPRPTKRAPYALAWRGGPATARAMRRFEAGDKVAELGPIYPHAPRREGDPGILATSTGRRAFVEPHVRCLHHADAPNLRVASDGTALWLVATGYIPAGELLTLDKSVALDVPAPARRRQARGWTVRAERPAARHPTHATTMGEHRATERQSG